MNNQEYIRKAAEIIGWDMDADGWLYPPRDGVWGNLPSHVHWSWKWVQDIIAAQLVRQVDALEGDADPEFIKPILLHIFAESTAIDDCRQMPPLHKEYDGPDRTMNTIKAIVDSGVLK